MKHLSIKLIALAIFFVFVEHTYSSIQTKKDDTPKLIQITDQTTQQELQNAYNSIVIANKDFQIAILRAKVKYKVPEDWEFNASTLSFNPPPPRPIPPSSSRPIGKPEEK